MYRSLEEKKAGEKAAAATVRYFHFRTKQNLKAMEEALKVLEKVQQELAG